MCNLLRSVKSYWHIKLWFIDCPFLQFIYCNILGLIIDKLNFKSHISELCKKSSQKIGALCRLSSYLNHYKKKKTTFNSIIKSQFNYCPLVWMFCSWTSNNMINKLHNRSFRIVLNDYSSDFNKLLEKINDICNHHRNIQTMLTEGFKMKNEKWTCRSYYEVNNYNFWNFQGFVKEGKITTWYGLEALSYQYPQMWSL